MWTYGMPMLLLVGLDLAIVALHCFDWGVMPDEYRMPLRVQGRHVCSAVKQLRLMGRSDSFLRINLWALSHYPSPPNLRVPYAACPRYERPHFNLVPNAARGLGGKCEEVLADWGVKVLGPWWHSNLLLRVYPIFQVCMRWQFAHSGAFTQHVSSCHWANKDQDAMEYFGTELC